MMRRGTTSPRKRRAMRRIIRAGAGKYVKNRPRIRGDIPMRFR